MGVKLIVFMHGLHENAHGWQDWIPYFEYLGNECHAPNYPFYDGEAESQWQNPPKEFAKIRRRNVVEHHVKFINQMPTESRILIGHSMAGLIVQKLLETEKGSLSVCLTSASPKGVLSLKWSFINSNIGVVNPLWGNTLYCGSKESFQYAICNTLSKQKSI